MNRSIRTGWCVLLWLLLAACGREDVAEPAASRPPPEPVDPASLEIDLPIEPEPLARVALPAWQPPAQAIKQAEWRKALVQAESAVAAGRLLSDDSGTGALEWYLGVLLADTGHPKARAGRDQVLLLLVAQAEESLLRGQIELAERAATVLHTLQPEHEQLAPLRTAIDVARRAADSVRRAQTHARAGRILAPGGRNAVASYREALGHLPGYLPALDGLAVLEQERLNRGWSAAQAGDYEGAERLLEQARQIRPDSGATQDMGARIVELRQARTDDLLAQGHAALDAVDPDLAKRRLEEARVVSPQSQGLDALAERIDRVRHYGRHLPGQVFRDGLSGGGEGPEMVVLPHGVFTMGSPESERHRQDNEGPVRAVTFARGFALGRSEISVAEFRRFVEATGYRSVASRRGRSVVYDEKGGAMVEHAGVDWQRDHAGRTAAPELPVVHVAFEDAEAYAAWLSAQTGHRYRLPSEAELEYALRAGTSTAFPWGDVAPSAVLGNLTGDGDISRSGRRWSNAIKNYADGHWGPAPVRSYPEEGFGTFDLIGNVSEWVQDCWHDSYRRAPVDGSAWVNAGCEERVLRGASWASSLDRARSAYRQSAASGLTHARLGLRVVREI